MLLERWFLADKEVRVPHVWGSERDLRWEGPAVYETAFLSTSPGWLIFHGVSALARVYVNGELVCEHLGIWDAFSVRVERVGEISVRVEVTKNGGETIPVSSIASGFLPFVFGTFGGIYKPVEWIEQDGDPLANLPSAPPRARFERHKLFVDDKPIYLRGVLHWGWYPELRHPNPSADTCEREIDALQAMGFNCVKFCLWLPPHHYLDLLRAKGMLAWIELPIWNPGGNFDQFTKELERIVVQYRHYESIILWTVGCELGAQISRADRKCLFDLVKDLTGGLLKDSSGGAEMYGGDPVEFGDFEDFHPYCDLAEYPAVLDSLQAGPRKQKAILLGECNDFDSHRDLPRIVREQPFWASGEPALNDKGVRWQYDLPTVLNSSRYARDEIASARLMKQSLEMKVFAHSLFQAFMRERNFSGSVLTGIADTPISSSGFLDDWGNEKVGSAEVRKFMTPDLMFLIPQRKLPWANGGNRVARYDSHHYFAGEQRLRIGMHSESGFHGEIAWQVDDQRGLEIVDVKPLEATEIADIAWSANESGSVNLFIDCKTYQNSWQIVIVERPDLPIELPLAESQTFAAPSFRECAYDWESKLIEALFAGTPHTLFGALTNRFLDPKSLPVGSEIIMWRVDTRTYRELPVVARHAGELYTTLLTDDSPVGVLVKQCLAKL